MAESPDPIESAWEAMLGDWEDPEAHKRFVALCMSLGRLAEAGKRYRQVIDTDETRRAEAQRQIDAILVTAMSTMEAHRTPAPPKRNTTLLLVAAAVFVLLVGTATWAVMGGP